jgi:hypothetical protein
MIELDKDILCKSPLWNPSNFPTGSANFLNPNYNILPFLCDILKVANDETVDPVIVEPPEFDLTPFTNFIGLLEVGDPRVSLGLTLSATWLHFLPRVITQTEVRQAGGVQVINNVVCDSEGMPVRKGTTQNVELSLDLSGRKEYKFGALTVPPSAWNIDDLLKRFTPEDVKDFVSTFVQTEKEKHATQFTDFISKWFLSNPQWKVSLSFYKMTRNYFVVLDLRNASNVSTQRIYLKYYDDVMLKVAKNLNVKNIDVYNNMPFGNVGIMKGFSEQTFDYKKIMATEKSQKDHYDYIIKNLSIDPRNAALSYNTLFTANSANVVNAMANMFLQQARTQITTNTAPVSSITVN